jgi:NADH-quinone oxidoreductase subunit F
MELSVRTGAPTAAERGAVDGVLGPPASGWDGGSRSDLDGHVAFGPRRKEGERRHLLLPALHAIQERVGWVSPEALGYLCTRLDVPPAEAYGVASAYALFSFEPSPDVVVHVCDDVACRAATGGDPTGGLPGPNGRGGVVAWRTSPCLGHCEHGSAALVQLAGARGGRAVVAPFSTADYETVAACGGALDLSTLPEPARIVPQSGSRTSQLRLLRRVGVVDPRSLDAYRAAGGYEALRRAVEIGPASVIAELKVSKLLGRGGAAFPTGLKWEAVAANPGRPHYFVANADESEPGTFKDRVLLEHDPFALVEALTIAGVTTGAERGFVYVRAEYPLAARRVEQAAEQARVRGLLGDDVMGSGLHFDIEVRQGAGAYIAGEETALFNSIEGRRPEPRNKPPFPAERGLFGKPTGVNNVETLLCVLDVLTGGGAAFASVGTDDSAGTRLFCLSGRVSHPGLYEVPMGTSLGSLLELAGGVAGGRALTAVLLGGAAGSFVGPDALDMPLSFEGARAAGTTLGSGVVLVLDDTVDVTALLRRIAQFFRDESCGQCVPCRVGTQRQEEVLARLVAGRPLGSTEAELALLADVDAVMRDASICGLGQTASAAVMSALRRGLVTVTQ